MHLTIDASNIRDGGGITHLRELLLAAEPQKFGFTKIKVWASQKTLATLPKRDWLVPLTHSFLDKSLPYRLFWQIFLAPKAVGKQELLFVPGGAFYGNSAAVVVMQSNILPFCKDQLRRAGVNFFRLRLQLLRMIQRRTLKKALVSDASP